MCSHQVKINLGTQATAAYARAGAVAVEFASAGDSAVASAAVAVGLSSLGGALNTIKIIDETERVQYLRRSTNQIVTRYTGVLHINLLL